MNSLRWVRLLVLAGLLGVIPFARARKAAYDLDRKIAKFAIMHGNNYLAKDVSSKRGFLLVKFGSAIDPENEIALLATGYYLQRGKRPAPLAVPVSEKEVLDVMIRRAVQLSKVELPKNLKVGPLCRLYATFAEQERPDDPDVILLLTRLGAKGFKDDLQTALGKALNLKDIFNEPQRPPATTLNVKLGTKDLMIAAAAADLGTNRLASDSGDALGLKLLQMAGQMLPDDDRVLLAMGMLFRGKKPTALKTKYTEKRLKEMLILRGNELIDKEDENRRRLGLLYLRMAEEFGIEDRIVLGIARLGKMGLSGELHELLTTAVKTVPVATKTDKLELAPESVGSGFTKSQIKNIDIDCDVDKKRLRKTDNYEPTEIVVTVEVENKNPIAIEDVSLSVYIISSRTRSRKQFIVTRRTDFDHLKLGPKKSMEPVSVKATCYEYTTRLKKYAPVAFKPEHWESYYYCYVAVLRDANGKVIKVEQSREASLIRDALPKLADMQEDWHFNRDGQVTGKDPEVPRITGTDTVDSIRSRWRPPSWGRRRR